MATNPEDIKRGYLAWRQQQSQNQQDDNQFNQTDDRSALENAGRGAMSGLAKSGYGTMGMVGKLLSSLGGQNVGDAIQKYAHDNAQEAQAYYDPHGMAGKLGEGAANIVGNTAQFAAGGEVLGGGDYLAAKGAEAMPRVLGSSAGQAALRVLPGATAHAAVNGITAQPETGDPGFWKTLRNDELGAGAVGGALGMAKGVGGVVGKIGSKLAGMWNGGDSEAVGDAIGQMPPAPPAAATAPTPAAPTTPDFAEQVKAAMGAQEGPDFSKVGETIDNASSPRKLAKRQAAEAAQGPRPEVPDNFGENLAKAIGNAKASSAAMKAQSARPSPAEMIPAPPLAPDEANLGPASKANLLTPEEEAQVQAFRDKLAGAREPLRTSAASGDRPAAVAAATESRQAREGIDKVIKGARVRGGTPAKAEAPKPTDVQADAEVSKPAQSAKKGSQKGGPAKATVAESNSGTGAQGAPKASKPAPATKPAASDTPAATSFLEPDVEEGLNNFAHGPSAPAKPKDAFEQLQADFKAVKATADNATLPEKVAVKRAMRAKTTQTVKADVPATAPAKAPKETPVTPITRKNAVAERKGRIAPVAAKGNLTPEESTREADNISWLGTAKGLLSGLTEGSPAHTKLTAQIVAAEAENAGFAARRKTP